MYIYICVCVQTNSKHYIKMALLSSSCDVPTSIETLAAVANIYNVDMNCSVI